MTDMHGCSTGGPARDSTGDETGWLLLKKATARVCLVHSDRKIRPTMSPFSA